MMFYVRKYKIPVANRYRLEEPCDPEPVSGAYGRALDCRLDNMLDDDPIIQEWVREDLEKNGDLSRIGIA